MRCDLRQHAKPLDAPQQVHVGGSATWVGSVFDVDVNCTCVQFMGRGQVLHAMGE